MVAAPLRKGGCPAGPPIDGVSTQRLCSTKATPGREPSRSTARDRAAARSPRFAPSPIRQRGMKRSIRTSEKPGGDILATTWVADIRSLHRRPPSEFARNLQPSRLSGKLLYRELAPGKLGMQSCWAAQTSIAIKQPWAAQAAPGLAPMSSDFPEPEKPGLEKKMRYSKVIDPPSEATERNGEVLCRQTQPRIVPGKSSLSRIFHSE